jgi:LmbE family N-acetylglucosaminyl deacetylase
MIGLDPLCARRDGVLRVLCIGAHSDDIEIGCGGTLMQWLAAGRPLAVTWVVLSGKAARGAEARRSAKQLLTRAAAAEVVLGEFTDGRMPAEYNAVKDFFEALKARIDPDVIFTHRLEDRHQDHRLVGELTWNTWRNHLILEYEIVKYEGDLGNPNVFVPLPASTMRRKIRHLLKHFGSQRSKDWFSEQTFAGIGRLRGVEARAPSGFAEAFHARKIMLSLAQA